MKQLNYTQNTPVLLISCAIGRNIDFIGAYAKAIQQDVIAATENICIRENKSGFYIVRDNIGNLGKFRYFQFNPEDKTVTAIDPSDKALEIKVKKRLGLSVPGSEEVNNIGHQFER